MRLFMLIFLVVFSACASNPSATSLTPEQRSAMLNMKVVESRFLPEGSYEILGTVEGLSCKRNAWSSEPPTEAEAMQGVMVRAAQLGADAVANVICEQHGQDWGRNCWSEVICVGDAISVSDKSLLEGQ